MKLILTVTKDQKQWIVAEAKRLGVPLTEVIRRLIDVKRGAL